MKPCLHLFLSAGALFGLIGTTHAAGPLNNPNNDLIYVAVAPCRLVDTLKSTGGNLVAGVPQNFRAYGNVASQGGNAAGCPHPKQHGGPAPAAMSANITAVGTGASANGLIKAFAAGGNSSRAVALANYTKGTNIANAATIALCKGGSCPDGTQLALLSLNADVRAAVDILGYFYPKDTNVLTVATDGGDFKSPIAAITYLRALKPAPSATNPWVIKIDPGVYELGAKPLRLSLEGVTVRGSGPGTTVLNGHGGGAPKTGTVIISTGGTSLEDLTVTTTSGTQVNRVAVSVVLPDGASGTGPVLSRVHAVASLGTGGNIGLDINNAVLPVRIRASQVSATGGDSAIGLRGRTGKAVLEQASVAHADAGNTMTRGAALTATFALRAANSEISAEGTGSVIDALLVSGAGTSVIAHESTFAAAGGLSAPAVVGIRVGSGGKVGIDRSNIAGDTGSIQADATSVVRVGSSQLQGAAVGTNLACAVSWNGTNFAPLGGACN